MPNFHELSLELVRPGPPHNQLLSPLTPYMALCGDGSPITFRIELEHRQLLNRLEGLRYITPGAPGERPQEVPDRFREAGLKELGDEVAKIFASIPTLTAELRRAGGLRASADAEGVQGIVHLRLVLSGSELALIPYELSVAPPGYPGEGLEFCLQINLPIVVTREVRRTRPLPTPWNSAHRTRPRILFVFAAPAGMSVPSQAHANALRNAIDPWVKRCETQSPQERLKEIRRHLRILTNACIEDIYRECASGDFTYVHVLAHGAHYREAGETRFGVALCNQRDRREKHVISGGQLAKALQAESVDGNRRSRPLLVSLMICDSGNQGSVLVPGGSIAHDLHSNGIPWIIGSQLPLTKLGSVKLTEDLYPRLLRGDDPRHALVEVRRQLYLSAKKNHDWASLIAYASVDPNFREQVYDFFQSQTMNAINVAMARADDADPSSEDPAKALKLVEAYLLRWRGRLPLGDSPQARSHRAECFGIHGSTYKRIALLHASRKQDAEANEAYREALEAYREAMAEDATGGVKYHWTATQYLSLAAWLDRGPDPDTHDRVTHLAKAELLKARDPSREAWAHGSLAELTLLALYHRDTDKVDTPDIKRRVAEHCRSIVDLMGYDSFHVKSTGRQFKRYRDRWQKDEWLPAVEAALRALDETDSDDVGA